jgi:pilus assembly protein CpaE
MESRLRAALLHLRGGPVRGRALCDVWPRGQVVYTGIDVLLRQMSDPPTTGSIRVLIADEIVRVLEGLEEYSLLDDQIVICGVARSPASLFGETRQLQPDVILINETFRGIDPMAATHELSSIVPTCRAVLLSPDPAAAEARARATRAGIKEILPINASLPDIVAAIRRAHADSLGYGTTIVDVEPIQPVTPRKVRRGSRSKAEVFVVFSGKGGVGTSVISTNLAAALSIERDARVALIDLDLQFGDIRVMLNVDFPSSIEVLAQQGDQVDTEFLEDVVAPGPGDLKILLAPSSPELADLVTTGNLRSILREMVKLYDYIIVDTSSHLDERILEAIEQADQLLVVTAATVPAVKDARVTLKLLSTLGIAKDKVSVVLNQTRAKVPFPRVDVEETLRFRIISQLPFDPKTVDGAVDKGRTFYNPESKAEIVREFRLLVDYLSPLEEPGPAEPGAAEAPSDGAPATTPAKRRFSLGRN